MYIIAKFMLNGTVYVWEMIAIPDMQVSELVEKKIYCRYYYERKLLDYKIEPPVEMYPECKTLLEKVKAYEK